ncbi:MAG: cytochrome c [Gammaproteobacteria bacterium]
MQSRMSMGKLGKAMAAAALAAAAATAQAQDLTADQAKKITETRQGVLKVVGWSIGPMGAMVRGVIPWNQAVFAERAQRIAWMSTMLPDAFAPDTSAFDLETEALPVIWEKHDRFETLAGNLQASAARLAEVAAGGDEAASKEAFGAMVDDCRACHDEFREDDN